MRTFLLIILAIILNNHCFSQELMPDVKGDYLGQETPKDSAIIFAPEIISITNRYEYALSISPNHDEIYFTAEGSEDPNIINGLIRLKRYGDNWSIPEIANLNQKKLWEQEAFFSQDGKLIYYAVSDSTETKIWFSEKTKIGWSKGKPLNSPINEASKRLFYATLSENNNLYYTNVDEFKIYKTELLNGVYSEYQEIGLPRSGHAFIAPDESFILIDSRREDNYGKMDIYVAFKQDDGTWSKPINLGPKVNTEFSETCPGLSPDGKFIFFGRYNDENDKSNIYWISSDIINELKP